MSADRTSEEIIDDILYPKRQELREMEMRLRILVATARKEGQASAGTPKP